MTFTIQSQQIDRYMVELKQEKFSNCFTVSINEQHGGQWYTYRKSNPQPDMARAKATYRRYLREVKSMA